MSLLKNTVKVEPKGIFSPLWFNKVRQQKNKNCNVELKNNKYYVLVEGEKLYFDKSYIPKDTKGEVWLGGDGFFYFKDNKTIKEEEQKRIELAEVERQKTKERFEYLELKARCFWAKYNLPVKSMIFEKHVLSGLTKNSNGDGLNKKSVNHLYLLESLHEKRIKRAPNTFLCSSNPKQDGKKWILPKEPDIKISENLYIENDYPVTPVVTCKQCLKFMERWKTPISELEEKEINWTVARDMVRTGYKFTNFDILKFADNKGWTIAHEIAAEGKIFEDIKILQLTDDKNRSVADICDEIHNTDRFDKILQEAEKKEDEENDDNFSPR